MNYGIFGRNRESVKKDLAELVSSVASELDLWDEHAKQFLEQKCKEWKDIVWAETQRIGIFSQTSQNLLHAPIVVHRDENEIRLSNYMKYKPHQDALWLDQKREEYLQLTSELVCSNTFDLEYDVDTQVDIAKEMLQKQKAIEFSEDWKVHVEPTEEGFDVKVFFPHESKEVDIDSVVEVNITRDPNATLYNTEPVENIVDATHVGKDLSSGRVECGQIVLKQIEHRTGIKPDDVQVAYYTDKGIDVYLKGKTHVLELKGTVVFGDEPYVEDSVKVDDSTFNNLTKK